MYLGEGGCEVGPRAFEVHLIGVETLFLAEDMISNRSRK